MDNISIGDELKDGFKPTDAWIKAGLNWLTDIEVFYKERASIEREYSEKLKNLCAKGFEKRAKVSTLLSVGENPTVTPGSLESATLVGWNEILTQTENISKERANFASLLDSQVIHSITDMQTKKTTMQHVKPWRPKDPNLRRAALIKPNINTPRDNMR
ncbi:unnamed protein product [Ambrosiozyma monospora]|uniref:Unnamed protein product n=1 Tax=Ambrosiozyma monospora TaxID=43982 RepID=A0ACB5T863_AMBMO|nr:unnamed protein product [Ambrosiozyma monospora]